MKNPSPDDTTTGSIGLLLAVAAVNVAHPSVSIPGAGLSLALVVFCGVYFSRLLRVLQIHALLAPVFLLGCLGAGVTVGLAANKDPLFGMFGIILAALVGFLAVLFPRRYPPGLTALIGVLWCVAYVWARPAGFGYPVAGVLITAAAVNDSAGKLLEGAGPAAGPYAALLLWSTVLSHASLLCFGNSLVA